MTGEERQRIRDLIDAKTRDDLHAAQKGERSKRAAYWRRYYRENRERILQQRADRRGAP